MRRAKFEIVQEVDVAEQVRATVPPVSADQAVAM